MRQDIDRLKKRVDGIALTASHDPAIADILQELKAEGVPVVVLHSPTDITGYERILIDDDYCIKITLDHLLEQGHRRIGFVGVKQSVTCRRRQCRYLVVKWAGLAGVCWNILKPGKDRG